MKNITVSIPEEIYFAAQVSAAERGQSVSSLVSEYLQSLSQQEAEFRRLEAQQKRVQQEVRHFSARNCLSRDEVHTRETR